MSIRNNVLLTCEIRAVIDLLGAVENNNICHIVSVERADSLEERRKVPHMGMCVMAASRIEKGKRKRSGVVQVISQSTRPPRLHRKSGGHFAR